MENKELLARYYIRGHQFLVSGTYGRETTEGEFDKFFVEYVRHSDIEDNSTILEYLNLNDPFTQMPSRKEVRKFVNRLGLLREKKTVGQLKEEGAKNG